MNQYELYDMLDHLRHRDRSSCLTFRSVEPIVEFGYRVDDVKDMIMKANATGWRGPDIALAYSPIEARARIKHSSRYGAIYS